MDTLDDRDPRIGVPVAWRYRHAPRTDASPGWSDWTLVAHELPESIFSETAYVEIQPLAPQADLVAAELRLIAAETRARVLSERLEEARKALRPFAERVEAWDKAGPSPYEDEDYNPRLLNAMRRAADVLSGTEDRDGGKPIRWPRPQKLN